MTKRGKGRYALLLGAALVLGGCQAGTQPFGFLKGGASDAVSGDVTGGVAAAAGPAERDVEAPDIFNLNDTGLWDGRPSLGGVWVAHGSVTEPERVMIRNPENGRSVVVRFSGANSTIPGQDSRFRPMRPMPWAWWPAGRRSLRWSR